MGRSSGLVVRGLTVALLPVALLCCKKSGPKEVKGSCDMRGSTGGSSLCIEFHEEPNAKVKEICTGGGVGTLAATGCDRAAALGGCSKGKLTNWYYTSSKHSSAEDVKKECADDFVAAGAAP
jgi:hypothetical protein